MEMTQQEQRMVMRRVSKAISCIQDGEDAKAVLSRIYCENLPDKSPRQGDLMASELIRWMHAFQANKGRAQTRQEDMEDALPELPALDKAAFRERKEAKWAVGEEMALAVTAMILYTMAKNGELSGLHQDATLSQVVLAVCAEDACREAQDAVARGFLTGEQAQKKQKNIWLCFYGLLAGMVMVTSGLLATVGLGAGIVAWVAGTAYGVYRVLGQMAQDEELPRMEVLEIQVESEEVVPATGKLRPVLREEDRIRQALEEEEVQQEENEE